MSEELARIKRCEARIEEALWSLEVAGENAEALEEYRAAEADLETLLPELPSSSMAEGQRVLAYCLLRQGNALRVLGQADEARRLSDREIAAARASGDSITLARSLLSHGTNLLVAGEKEKGMQMLEESRSLFASGHTTDHKQGMGWCWILQADLTNAGMLAGGERDVIAAAERALEALLPIDNWPGIARAYAARAAARERLGNAAEAEADRKAQKEAEAKIPSQPDRGD